MPAVVRASIVAAAGVVGACAMARPMDTVVMASGADLESGNPLVTVHPLARQVQRHALFVTLARFDAALEPTPYAARRWEWSPDRRSLTLHLATTLRWHDDSATTARDVVFTLRAARDPATGFPRSADLASLEAVEALDDSTVVLRYERPQAAFPPILCELPIVPRHLLEGVPLARMRQSAFATNPVGNGPFRFVRREANRRWIFERNSTFPMELGGPPALRRFVVAVVDEAATKFAGLVSGELDIAGIAPSMATLVQRDPSLAVLSYPLLFSTSLVFNTSRAPFDDAKVRRAVNASLDRQRIIDIALGGFGTPAAGPVSPDNPLAIEAAPSRDTRLADSLLDAAGWPRGANGTRARDGQPFRIELLTVSTNDNAIEQLIQADLRSRGIAVDIRVLELGSFLTRARERAKTFDVLFTGIPGDLTLSYLVAMYHSSYSGGALDYAGFHTPQLDSLFDAVRRAASAEQIRAAWRGVQEQLAADMPAASVYHARGVQGIARRLTGVQMDLRGELATITAWQVNGPASAAPGAPRVVRAGGG